METRLSNKKIRGSQSMGFIEVKIRWWRGKLRALTAGPAPLGGLPSPEMAAVTPAWPLGAALPQLLLLQLSPAQAPLHASLVLLTALRAKLCYSTTVGPETGRISSRSCCGCSWRDQNEVKEVRMK